MAHNTSGSSGNRPREGLVTLPSIRVVFGEQLNYPPTHSSPRPRAAQMAGSDPASYISSSRSRSSSSQDVHYARQDGSEWGASVSPRNRAGDLRQSHPPHSYGGTTPESFPRRSTSDYSGSHRSSPVIPPIQAFPSPSGGHYAPSSTSGHYRSTPNRANDPSRPPPAPSSAWTDHRRRDSTDSAWSSSSSSASSHPRSNPSANALQFQPLPHAQMTPVNSRPPNHAHYPTQQTPADYQSPFGVLIVDMDPNGVPPSDPQRQAIMRLRAQGAQGSFQINFDDPSNSHNSSMRYACQYCGKRFTRPSSLRIHNNSHTGERPFECPHTGCGRRFSVHSNMRRHARVHEGSTPKGGESSGDELAED